MADQPIIEVRKLSKRFGAIPALQELDLTVHCGESLAVFGPNGAGKTTLIRILTLALRPTSGSVRLAGLNPSSDEREIKRVTGVISHHALLYDELTANENLQFFARLYGVENPEARAETLLQAVGLSDRGDDSFRTLSRGMQQRLSVARCLVHDPPLVYMDEPFSGLDPHAAQMLRETLGRLREEGRTLLLATHNFAQGLGLSDRWILLDRGRLVDEGESASTDRAAFEDSYRARSERPGHVRGGQA